jgi:hypothetical protein
VRRLCAVLLLVGCPKPQNGEPPASQTQAEGARKDVGVEASPDEPHRPSGDPHVIVFADRTSQGYLLLVDDAHKDMPTRADLQFLVRSKLGAKADEPELQLLLELIDTEPADTRMPAPDEPSDGRPRATRDLLGLHIELLPMHGDAELVSTSLLTDPVLARELSPEERASLAKRRQALLLRADYRNQYAVRGLRLLQTLVRIVANDRKALVHDPDTGETMGVEAFTRRRLLSSLGNVADQIAVVPFPDPRHGEGFVRLSTRGMRRFGSVDVELDGLPRDPKVLQRATDLMYGLAYQLVRLGEFDSSGYAVELDEVVDVEHADIVQAYGSRGGQVPPACKECEGQTTVHLVERPAEPHDPSEHVVARVVAPREESDAAGYDQKKWVLEAVASIFGK